MTRRAVWTIGAGQCVGWGVLYYAFDVLVVRNQGFDRDRQSVTAQP